MTVLRMTMVLVVALSFAGRESSIARARQAENLRQASMTQFTAALNALGGAARLDSLRSLSAILVQRDRVAQPRRNGAAPLAFQFLESEKTVDIRFPDSFLVRSRVGPQGVENRWGFAAGKNIGSGPLEWRFREVFGYFALPLSWRLQSAFPFTLERANSDGFRLRDQNKVEVEVAIDPQSGRPITLSYDRVLRTMSGEPTGDRVASRMVLADYRAIDGLWFPHSIKVFEGDLLIEERLIRKLALNVEFSADHFR